MFRVVGTLARRVTAGLRAVETSTKTATPVAKVRAVQISDGHKHLVDIRSAESGGWSVSPSAARIR